MLREGSRRKGREDVKKRNVKMRIRKEKAAEEG